MRKASKALPVLSPTCGTSPKPHTERVPCKGRRIQIHQRREKLAYELELNEVFAHNNIYFLQPYLIKNHLAAKGTNLAACL